MLPNGIVLIDAPDRDDLVHDELPSADAVLCLISRRGLSRWDKEQLTTLNRMGFREILICLPEFDLVRAVCPDAEDPASYIRSFRSACREFTQLGEKGIFFLSSMEDLHAKPARDDRLPEGSGCRDLEASLESFLVSRRASPIWTVSCARRERSVSRCTRPRRDASRTAAGAMRRG